MTRSPLSPPQAPPSPEDILKGYCWPASRITKKDMMKLTELRAQTGLPLTVLLHEAVSAYHALLTQGHNRSDHRPKSPTAKCPLQNAEIVLRQA